MHRILLGLMVVIGLTAIGWTRTSAQPQSADVPPQISVSRTPNDGLITHHLTGGPQGDLIVVIDPTAKSMAVYRVQRERGDITLAAVRRFQWDLQMQSFNNGGLLPEEIRAGLARQQ